MSERLDKVADALGEKIAGRFVLSRGGHPLLALPRNGAAAKRALRLYQPQRGLAKCVAALLRAGAGFGLHRLLLPGVRASVDSAEGNPGLLPAGVDRNSIGILFGSPEHRVFRGVLSYRNGDLWEVGKLAIGPEGMRMLEREASVMRDIGSVVPEVPELLGLETSTTSRLLRMPYLTGHGLDQGNVKPVLGLLQSWLSRATPRPLHEFSEWSAITKGLQGLPAGEPFQEKIADLPLRPSIRHGDLARWNLLHTTEGRLKVLDWEWGERHGLPGIDLVHYLAQDFRLVQRLAAPRVLDATVDALKSPVWHSYLEQTGWAGNERALIIACLAYKQGAGHQDNQEILKIARFG